MSELTLKKQVPTHISGHPLLKFACPHCGVTLTYSLEDFYKHAYPGWNYIHSGSYVGEPDSRKEARVLCNYSMFNKCPGCSGDIVLRVIPSGWKPLVGRPAGTRQAKYKPCDDYREDVDYGTPRVLRLEAPNAHTP